MSNARHQEAAGCVPAGRAEGSRHRLVLAAVGLAAVAVATLAAVAGSTCRWVGFLPQPENSSREGGWEQGEGDSQFASVGVFGRQPGRRHGEEKPSQYRCEGSRTEPAEGALPGVKPPTALLGAGSNEARSVRDDGGDSEKPEPANHTENLQPVHGADPSRWLSDRARRLPG